MKPPRPIQSAIDWLRTKVKALRTKVKLPKLEGVDRRLIFGGAGTVVVLFLIWALLDGPFAGDDERAEVETRVVTVAIETDDASEAPVGPLGFPLVATRNTTRVGGDDPAVNAAAVALATHPASPDAKQIEAAVLVSEDSPYGGIAASVLAGPPLRAPILIGGDSLPVPTADALAKLNPKTVYLVGGPAAPPGYKTESIGGGSPEEVAGFIDELRAELVGVEPEHVLIATDEDPGYAMPAAAWAARSGDPVFFTGTDEVPDATLTALKRHGGAAIYVLGPQSAISEKAVRQLERVSPGVQRVGAEGRVANAIAFAQYSDQGFGWNVTLPGHGLVLANADRPLDAAAGAALSASGKWGPLLLIDSAGTLPPELQSFLLDIKPGYVDDPTAAVYNHVWLIGDSSTIGARVQAEIDELAELAEVGPGVGGPPGPAGSAQSGAGAPDAEVDPDAPKAGAKP